MFVVRGEAGDLDADRLIARQLLTMTGTSRRPTVRVWQPAPHVAFGPRDVRHPNFDAAAARARSHGYPVVERSVGGHPVVHTDGTLIFAWSVPVDDLRHGMHDRYDAASDRLMRAMASLGVTVEKGEPPGAFCPGSHSLSAKGKIVGIAQRVTAEAAIVSGIVVVHGRTTIADVLGPMYAELELAFDPAAVGSVRHAGGPSDPTIVREAIECSLVGKSDSTSIDVNELSERVASLT